MAVPRLALIQAQRVGIEAYRTGALPLIRSEKIDERIKGGASQALRSKYQHIILLCSHIRHTVKGRTPGTKIPYDRDICAKGWPTQHRKFIERFLVFSTGKIGTSVLAKMCPPTWLGPPLGPEPGYQYFSYPQFDGGSQLCRIDKGTISEVTFRSASNF